MESWTNLSDFDFHVAFQPPKVKRLSVENQYDVLLGRNGSRNRIAAYFLQEIFIIRDCQVVVVTDEGVINMIMFSMELAKLDGQH